MSGAIAYALKKIALEIPQQILNEVFAVKQYRNSSFYSVQTIESIIKEKIIVNHVIPDIALNAGTEMNIPILPAWISVYEDPPRTLISIPPEARQLQQIVSVLSVGYSAINNAFLPTTSYMDVGSSNQLGRYGKMVLDAVSISTPLTSVGTHITPDGGGIVLLDAPRITAPLVAKVMIGYDQYMSELTPRMYPLFKRLCVAMTKSYIYNQYDIDIDKGQVIGGVTISRFAERVREYSESLAEYNELLDEWLAGEVYSQPSSKIRYFDSLIGPGR